MYHNVVTENIANFWLQHHNMKILL